MEATFPLIGNVFFSKFYTRVVETDFLSSENYFLTGAIFLLVETIIGIRRKQFSKKKLILASGQLISRPLKTIFSLHFLETPASDSFFPSIGKVFFNEILHLLVETDIMANNGLHKQENKRILLDKNSNSISQNEGFAKKIRLHYAENLLSPAGISKNKPSKVVSSSRREVTL